MKRCHRPFLLTLCCVLVIGTSSLAWAQPAAVMRHFPDNAMRGVMVFSSPNAVQMGKNKERVEFAPGLRIHDTNNLLLTVNDLRNANATVNYTLDTTGRIQEIWLLTPQEVKQSAQPHRLNGSYGATPTMGTSVRSVGVQPMTSGASPIGGVALTPPAAPGPTPEVQPVRPNVTFKPGVIQN